MEIFSPLTLGLKQSHRYQVLRRLRIFSPSIQVIVVERHAGFNEHQMKRVDFVSEWHSFSLVSQIPLSITLGVLACIRYSFANAELIHAIDLT